MPRDGKQVSVLVATSPFLPSCHSEAPWGRESEGENWGAGVPKSQRNGREWDERVGERSKSSFLQRRGGEELFDGQERELLFISAPTLRTAPLGVRKGNRDLLQHEDREQLLAGFRGRPCFRVRTRESSPGNGEPLYPDGGTGGALRCLTLLETYRSFNGLFNALFSR